MRKLAIFLSLVTCGMPAVAADDPPSQEQVHVWIAELGTKSGEELFDRARKLSDAYEIARIGLVRVFPHGATQARYWSARILVDAVDPRNARVLARLAETDHDAQVRIVALKGLQRLPNYDLGPLLVECLARDADPGNRKTLLRMIAVRREANAVSTILDLIGRSYDEPFIARAYDALRTISGLCLPDDLGAWQAWWDAQKGRRTSDDG